MALSDRRSYGKDWSAPDPAWTALRLRERQAVAMADLFLPHDGRLRDDDRVTIGRLLAELVGSVEHDLRQRLGTEFGDRPMLVESLLSRRIPIAWPLLEQSGGLRDAGLVRVLARRSEAARLATRIEQARERSREIDPAAAMSPIEPLASDADPTVAFAAARLIAAERSGRGAAGEPILMPVELPAELQHMLFWRVAAALRGYIVATQAVTPAEADPAIARAAAGGLAGYDEAATLPALASSLARALADAGRLDDALIADALAAAHVGFAVAGLAVRAGIGAEIAWDIALDMERLLLLCRAADVARPVAAHVALHLAYDGDDDRLADRLDAYDALPPAEAAAAIGLWRLDPAYLGSIAALAGEPGR